MTFEFLELGGPHIPKISNVDVIEDISVASLPDLMFCSKWFAYEGAGRREGIWCTKQSLVHSVPLAYADIYIHIL